MSIRGGRPRESERIRPDQVVNEVLRAHAMLFMLVKGQCMDELCKERPHWGKSCEEMWPWKTVNLLKRGGCGEAPYVIPEDGVGELRPKKEGVVRYEINDLLFVHSALIRFEHCRRGHIQRQPGHVP